MRRIEYSDFNVVIRDEPIDGVLFPVEIQSPVGEAKSTFRMPVLENVTAYEAVALYEPRLRAPLVAVPGFSLEIGPATPVEFGKALFDSLFAGDVERLYRESISHIRAKRGGLRIVLEAVSPKVAVLPWELLYDSSAQHYIALSTTTPLIRRLRSASPLVHPSTEPPIRILVIAASPRGVLPLNFRSEYRRIVEATASLEQRGLVQLDFLERATPHQLQTQLRRIDYQVIYYTGHAMFDEEKGAGALVLENDLGDMQLLQGQQLTMLLGDLPSLRLVVLNGCETGRTSINAPFSSIANNLLSSGVPAVVAFQFVISDEAGIAFSREFFAATIDGYPVDAAVAESRKAMNLLHPQTVEWAAPVLFTTSSDEIIFDINKDLREHREGLAQLYQQATQATQAGKWNQAADLLKQVLSEDGQYAAAAALLAVVSRRLVAEHRQRTEEDVEPVDPELAAFQTLWNRAISGAGQPTEFKKTVGELNDLLGQLLGFRQVGYRPRGNLEAFQVEAPNLMLRIPASFPVIYVRRLEGTEQDMSELDALINIIDPSSFFAMVVSVNGYPSRMQQGRDSICDYVFLDEEALCSIIAAKKRERKLTETILQQVDLVRVAPYVVKGPVPERMFFGRENEIARVVRTVKLQDYALVGGRKIGKTSALQKIERLLSSSEANICYYVDCQPVESPDELIKRLGLAASDDLSVYDLLQAFFERQARQQKGKSIIVLMDEVDSLLAQDFLSGEMLFRTFRTLAHKRHARFVFCGGKVLSQRIHNPESPLFNFCTEVVLGPLDTSSTRSLVVIPMSEIGIVLRPKKRIVDEIVKASSGHPNVAQYVCAALIERINERRSRRISNADLDAVLKSEEFQDHFIETVFAQAAPFERLIVLSMLDVRPFNLVSVREVLSSHGVQCSITRIQAALDVLVLYSILSSEGQLYDYTIAEFPNVLKRSGRVQTLMEICLEKTGV